MENALITGETLRVTGNYILDLILWGFLYFVIGWMLNSRAYKFIHWFDKHYSYHEDFYTDWFLIKLCIAGVVTAILRGY